MREFNQTIEIKEIIILSSNNEITMTGVVKRNMMTYTTHMGLDSTQLNLVINQLQKINPDNEISEMFNSRSGENGQILFFFNTNDLENNTLEIDSFSQNETILQVRA